MNKTNETITAINELKVKHGLIVNNIKNNDLKSAVKLYKEILEPLRFHFTKLALPIDKANLNNSDDFMGVLSKIEKSLDMKLNKLLKRQEKHLPPESDGCFFAKIFGLSIKDITENDLIESYETFSGKYSYDKEMLLSGAVPRLFNKELKTIRLANFFRAVKFANKLPELPLIQKREFKEALRMGKILTSASSGEEDVVYFKDINSKDDSYYKMDYSKKKLFKLDGSPSVRGNFKEIFARLDTHYIENVNILKLDYQEILSDMIIDKIDNELIAKRIRSSSNKNKDSSTILKRYEFNKIE